MGKSELETILTTFFHHQVVLKMYHFQTKDYGAHKTSDDYLASFLEDFDTFMESAQGAWDTLSVKNVNLKVKLVTDTTIVKYLDDFIEFLDTFEKLLGPSHTDLLNIRDEMKGDANRFKYLLRFR